MRFHLVDAVQSASELAFLNLNREPVEDICLQRASRINVSEISSLDFEAIDNEYEATNMGERVAQLYIDPLSADIILDGLRRAVRRIVRKLYLLQVSVCVILSPQHQISFHCGQNQANLNSVANSQKSALVEDELLIESPIDERAMGW